MRSLLNGITVKCLHFRPEAQHPALVWEELAKEGVVLPGNMGAGQKDCPLPQSRPRSPIAGLKGRLIDPVAVMYWYAADFDRGGFVRYQMGCATAPKPVVKQFARENVGAGDRDINAFGRDIPICDSDPSLGKAWSDIEPKRHDPGGFDRQRELGEFTVVMVRAIRIGCSIWFLIFDLHVIRRV